MSPEEFFADVPLGRAVLDRVREILEPAGPTIRVTKSQIAFRADRAFAWLWRPSQYLGTRGVDVVLELALEREDPSPRWKEVSRPTSGRWMHHLEVRDITELDEQVAAWLLEAAAAATAHQTVNPRRSGRR